MKHKPKVVYSKHYFGRNLFVVKLGDKYTMVYRSSGLSGTGHEGNIIPFSYLDANKNSYNPGWICKYMLYNKQHIPHRKTYFTEDVARLLAYLEIELKEHIAEAEEQEEKDVINIASNINDEITKFMDDSYNGAENMFDWADSDEYLKSIQ